MEPGETKRGTKQTGIALTVFPAYTGVPVIPAYIEIPVIPAHAGIQSCNITHGADITLLP